MSRPTEQRSTDWSHGAKKTILLSLSTAKTKDLIIDFWKGGAINEDSVATVPALSQTS